jgi:hypothetical protein
MNIQQQKVLVVTETSDPDYSAQDPCGIPQIKISMLLSNYPGPIFPLFGMRLSLKTSDKKDAPLELYDFLFRACSFSVFQEALDKIRRLKIMQGPYQRLAPEDTYPVQTIAENQLEAIFVYQDRQYIQNPFPLRERRILNPGWEEFDCKYRCM